MGANCPSTKRLRAGLTRLDILFTRWLARYSIPLLRISLGLVFLIFGAFKFFPDLSPTEDLVKQTIQVLTLGLLPADTGMVLVAVLETVLGLCLVTGRLLRIGLALLAPVMIGIASPIFLFYQELFPQPYAPTLAGQYVLLDVVLVGAALVVTAGVRGGRMIIRHDSYSDRAGPEGYEETTSQVNQLALLCNNLDGDGQYRADKTMALRPGDQHGLP